MIGVLNDKFDALASQLVASPLVAAVPTVSSSIVNNQNMMTNNITINNFRCVDVSYIAHDIVAGMIKRGDLHASLQEMVQLVHYNPDHPENMNAYLADASHEQGLFFRSGKWQPKPRDDLARLVMFNAAQVMNEHNDEPYDREFTRRQTDTFDRFYTVIGYDRRPLVETIDTMTKNKRAMEDMHPALTAVAVAQGLVLVSRSSA